MTVPDIDLPAIVERYADGAQADAVLSTGEVVQAVLAQLGYGPKVRSIGSHAERTDLDHVAALVESGGNWPPIVVTGVEGHIIDGHHRASAARRMGWTTIPAVVVDVDHRSAEGLAMAARANTEHGLPLTVAERKSIANRLLKETEWSDRNIAKACGLGHQTVGRLRPRAGGPMDHLRGREGADGKHYPAPTEAAERRDKAARHLEATPTASTRKVASQSGLSPATVAKLRRRIEAGGDPPPPRLQAVPPPTEEVPGEPPAVTAGDILGPTVAVPWVRDERCQVSNAARDFARAMDRFTGDALKGVEQRILDGCPPGDVAHMAAVTARETAAMWTRIADQLRQPRPPRSA